MPDAGDLAGLPAPGHIGEPHHVALYTSTAVIGLVGAWLSRKRLRARRTWAHEWPDPVRLAEHLELSVARDSGRSAGDEELFVTALLLEFPPGGVSVRIVDRGHPAPLPLTAHGTRRRRAARRGAPWKRPGPPTGTGPAAVRRWPRRGAAAGTGGARTRPVVPSTEETVAGAPATDRPRALPGIGGRRRR
ncbi:SpoIIE family protein phosphatase [Streptomyces sp. NPDC006971]|uniref:SpoIIE family protein phosphatase n=1 Tax=Streptomyces sp. NPDC006971 TaxID=3154784 RepID=UPI0033D5E5EA